MKHRVQRDYFLYFKPGISESGPRRGFFSLKIAPFYLFEPGISSLVPAGAFSYPKIALLYFFCDSRAGGLGNPPPAAGGTRPGETGPLTSKKLSKNPSRQSLVRETWTFRFSGTPGRRT